MRNNIGRVETLVKYVLAPPVGIEPTLYSRLPVNSRAHYHSATAEHSLVEHSGIEPDDGNLARIARYPIDVPHEDLVDLEGFEPPTRCLQNSRSPTEL